jgi:peptidylprolyl isomerase
MRDRIWHLCLALMLVIGLISPLDPAQAAPSNRLIVETTKGKFTIDMRPDLAPNHVARIRELVLQKFYDGIKFHRVIDGFMAQTGDPTGTGMGGSGKRLKAEFSPASHVRGTVSMARPEDINGADSQWFICYVDVPPLDGKYTIWGQVVEGMEVVDQLNKGAPENGGKVPNPDNIIRIRIAEAAK